jgi:hypothetical protein
MFGKNELLLLRTTHAHGLLGLVRQRFLRNFVSNEMR